MIKDDILYHCSYAMNCSTLNKAFGTNFQLTKKDYLKMEDLTEKKFEDFCDRIQNNDVDFCKYCTGTQKRSNWSISKKEREEWIED